MAVLAQGKVQDRPWGQTLGALGLRMLTGQLTLHAEDKDYAIAFDLGNVVGGWSALASDSAPRVALTNHLLSSTQVGPLSRRIAAQPDRDEVDVVAEVMQFTPVQVELLRSRIVAQRAARTFSVDAGDFTIEDEITIPVIPGAGLDIRCVVYQGARLNLSEQRLTDDLRHFGAYFVLKADTLDTLDRFGFTDAERTVLVELRAGTSLHELEAAHRDIDPRMVQAVVYALFACGACAISDAPALPRSATVPSVALRPPTAPTRAPSNPPVDAAPMPRPEPAPYGPFVSRTATQDPYPTRTPTPGLTSAQEAFPQRTPTPGSGRLQTENPFPMRTPTPPITGRSPTDNPFPMRTPTPPVPSRTTSGGARPVNGPDEAGVPRNRGTTAPPASRTATPSTPPASRTATPSTPPASRTATPSTAPPMRPDMPATSPLDPRTRTPRAPTASPVNAPRTGSHPITGRTPTDPPATTADPARARPKTAGPAISRTSTARKTAALVATRMILLDQGADHFALLGVPFDAPIELVRTTYLNLVRQLHPDKLAELDVDDPAGNATRLFGAMGNAFSVLTDPTRREAYVASVVAAGVGAPRTTTGDDVNTSPAAEAFRRGEAALRRDEPHEATVHFQKAIELSPQDVDYHGMLAWAQFCAAPDKAKIANETRRVLDRAIQRSTKPIAARLLLGRVERMLGRDREALRQFQIVLEEQPSHADARSEIRVIEARLAGNVGKKR